MNKILISAALLGSVFFKAHAADVSYDYVGISYIGASVNKIDIDVGGVQVGFSKLATDSVYFKLVGSLINSDFGENKNEMINGQVGIGYRAEIVKSVDLYGEAAWLTASNKLKAGEEETIKLKDNGFLVEIGTRLAFTHNFNSDVFVRHSNFSNFGNNTEYGVTLRFRIESVELVGQYRHSSNQKGYALGLQYNF